MAEETKAGAVADERAQITSKAVGVPSEDNKQMDARYWRDIKPLRGGSQDMRDEGRRLLPQRPREEKKQYNSRLDSSHLDPYYDDAIDQMVSRPFTRPVTIRGDVPEQLQHLEQNADRRGSTLTVFAREYLDAATDAGMSHLFVDFPSVLVDTAEQEQLLQAAPYFVHVKAWDLLGATFLTFPNGDDVMVRCRIRDHYNRQKMDSDDPYAQERIERIRVYTAPRPRSLALEDVVLFKRFQEQQISHDQFVDEGGLPGSVVSWERKPDEQEFTAMDRRPFRFPGIPLITLYTARRGRLRARPFFWKIADLNVKHWKFSSVHGAYVDVVQVAGWKRTGVEDAEQDDVPFGHAYIMDLTEDQDFGTIEHQGTAYETGKDFVNRMETRMMRLSLEPFVENQAGDITATGDQIRDAKSHSQIQYVIRANEMAIQEAYRYGAVWMNVNRPTSGAPAVVLPEDFRVDIFSEFTLGVFSAQETQALKADADEGYITHETYLAERKKRGGYSDTVDPEVESRNARKEQLTRMQESGGFEVGGVDEDEEDES